MRSIHSKIWLAGSVAAIAIGLSSPALAQDEAADQAASNDDGIAPIVVTAQRRAQNMQDVGVSVTAVTAETLRAQGITESNDLAKLAPGVVFDSSAGGSVNALLTIRGISQSDFSYHQEAPNSIFTDEVYNFSVGSASFSMFDIDRVEILRGPQGTLFGRASSGGLASFYTKRPTDYFEGYVEGGYGSYNSAYIEGAVGGPLTDSIRARISGKYERADGWYENKLEGGDDTFEQRFVGLRGQIEADVTDRLTARVAVEYGRNPRHKEGNYKPENFYIDESGQPASLPADVDAWGTGAGNDFNGYRDPYSDGQTGEFNSVGYIARERFMPTLYLDWEGDAVTVSSITNYTFFETNYNEDCDGTPYDYCQFPSFSQVKQWSQELRANGDIGALNYTVGAYYLDIDVDVTTQYELPMFNDTEYGYRNLNTISQQSETFALFGQLEYEITDALKLTGGLRWTRETKDFFSQLAYTELGSAYGGDGVYDPAYIDYDFSKATVGSLAHSSISMWSGKIGIDYRINPDVMVYASASRGVKGPGFNGNAGGTLSYEDTPFGDEVLYAYETGVKSELFDNHLILNASTFYYDYNGFQGFAFAGLAAQVGNYDGYFYGGEVELKAKLPAQIDVTFGAAYLKSKLYDVGTAYDGVKDQESIQAPRWTINGLVSKTFDIGDNSLMVGWSFDYVDERYASVDNNAATYLPSSFVHNARISYTLEDAGVTLAAFVDNISDVDRQTFAYDYVSFSGSVIKSYAKPRWWGVSVRKEF